MTKRYKVGVLGATGMVGQRFISLLEDHPWFDIKIVAASNRSAKKTYQQAVTNRWVMPTAIPTNIKNLIVKDVVADVNDIAREVDIVFCALDMDKTSIIELENKYASLNVAVLSNNSAHRWTDDVPMIIPEINPQHIELIHSQRKNRNWSTGLLAVKPNCSIQTYVPIISALKSLQPVAINVVSMQAISGAGKTFSNWPEMKDNVIPYIENEELKSESEPMKIWGSLKNNKIEPVNSPKISARCLRVPISDGHIASVKVEFQKSATLNELQYLLNNYSNPITDLKLPSSPEKFITYFTQPDRPQTNIDRELYKGMGISVGGLKQHQSARTWSFTSLSHNTIRGAAGGAILMAELLVAKNFIN